MTLNHTAHLALAEQSGSADGISRRTFLWAAAAAGGGLMLSLRCHSVDASGVSQREVSDAGEQTTNALRFSTLGRPTSASFQKKRSTS